MKIEKFGTREKLGNAAAALGAKAIIEAIAQRGQANIILATGQSQFETLDALTNEQGIAWGNVRMFHLDEYIGLPMAHGASFRKYLTERFLDRVAPLLEAVLIDGENDPEAERKRLGDRISQFPIDVAFVGIGENGHLAFNDPPVDFGVEDPYLVVDLDRQCRQQQFGEGWFAHIDDVPLRAISMSIKQIMKSRKIICSVPDRRKAAAVKNCLTLPVSNLHPASILQEHPDCTCLLDHASASLL